MRTAVERANDGAQLNARLRALLEAGRPRASTVVGLEHEYMVYRAGTPLDFRGLIHTLGLSGAKLHPTDRHRYFTPVGSVLMADGIVAEVATPPIELAPGFPSELDAWAADGFARLSTTLPPDVWLKGASTHLSVQCAPTVVDAIAWRYARTFAAAMMLLLDDGESPGLLIRPRTGRIELGGEYATGPRLHAAAVFATGSVLAMQRRGHLSQPDLPTLDVTIEPARRRFGWYVDRRAFGPDLYSHGRSAELRQSDGRTISAQHHLERCWRVARGALDGRVAAADLRAADLVVAGELPLPSETSIDRTPGTLPSTSLTHSLGDAMHQRLRGSLLVRATVATWDFIAFTVSDRKRQFVISIPRALLPRFLTRLDAGQLDAFLRDALNARLGDRVLATRQQTLQAALWGRVRESASLLPLERPGIGNTRISDVRVGKLPLSILLPSTASVSRTPAAANLVGQAPIARPTDDQVIPPPPPTDAAQPLWRAQPWLLAALLIALIVGALIVVLLTTSGGDDAAQTTGGVAPVTPVVDGSSSPAAATALPAGQTPSAATAEETTIGANEAPPGWVAAFANPSAFMSATFGGSFGSDGRLQSQTAPDWADSTSALAVRGTDGLLYVKLQAPAELLARLCGEVDVTEGSAHIGEGIDWCAPDAGIPWYFSNVQTLDLADPSGTVQLIICTGVSDSGDDLLLRIWLLMVLDDGSYDAIEFSTRTSSPAVASSEVAFPDSPAGFPHAVYSEHGAPGDASTTPGGSAPSNGGGTATSSDAPLEGLPEGLAPPSSAVGFVGNSGSSRLVRFTSTATITDITAFYSDALGDPQDIDGLPVWFTDGPGGIITISLTGSDGDATIDIVIQGG